MPNFNTVYLGNSNHKKYKKSQIEKIYIDHPLLKKTNFDKGHLYIGCYRAYDYARKKYDNTETVNIAISKLGSTDGNYKISTHYMTNKIDRYKFDLDKGTFFCTISNIIIKNEIDKFSLNAENVTFFIKLNKCGIRKMKSNLYRVFYEYNV